MLRLAEKQEGAGAGWINAGIYLFRAAAPRRLRRGECFRSSATGLRAHRTHGRFIDIGTPGSYAEASAFVGGGR